jgi:plasmid stabilization system protein ParE
MRIEFLSSARLDLIGIADHYRKVSGNALAIRMIDQIKSQIEVLADYPESAALYELVPGIRRLVVANGAYLVFYRISSSVQILHIRRGERVPATREDMN